MINETKWNTMCSKLSWSHYREVLTIKSTQEKIFYLSEAENKNLTQRELHEIIRLNTYSRIPITAKNKFMNLKTLNVVDMLPDPIIIKNNLLYNKLSEYVLKELILNNLDAFLSQLGYGFSYVGNEYKIKYDDTKNDTQAKTIGIIICKKENRFIIEYCSDERIIVRKFEII